jgi:hypothetical protein
MYVDIAAHHWETYDGLSPPLHTMHRTTHIFTCCKCWISGLIDLAHELDGAAWNLEPFLPGFVKEYEIKANGKTSIIMKKSFYNIGDRPFFKPFIPYDCEL